MKIALYGISRVGKDTLITRLVNLLSGSLVHIKGSSTLRLLSQKVYNTELSMISEEQKNCLRALFVDELKSVEINQISIIVDGHYAFPINDSEHQIAFTEYDLQAYDVFVYLKQPASKIMSNAKNSIEHKYYPYLQDENRIEAWINYEVDGLSKICNEHQKDFILVDGDFADIETFLVNLIRHPDVYIPSMIANKIINKIQEIDKPFDHVVLLDCDKTISIEDPTMSVVKQCGIDKKSIKDNFIGDYYTLYQFYQMHDVIGATTSKHILSECAQMTELNQRLLDDLNSNRSRTLFVGLTTGLGFLWQSINEKYKIFDVLIGKGLISNEKDIDAYMTPIIKGIIAEKLSKTFSVKAVGDSIIDMPMLIKSNQGYLIVNQKLDERIIKFLGKNNYTHLHQFSYNVIKYDQIKEVDSIW